MLNEFIKSWQATSGVYSTGDLLEWVQQRNATIQVSIQRIPFADCTPWYYNSQDGCIQNHQGSFFKLYGIEEYQSDGKIITQQPVIVQNEIGFLGILCKKINGVIHFLMQAKIEPGNLNAIQISPTIQATKSNFTQKHGGKQPPYLEFFLNVSTDQIVYDQIQSEQSSRFHKKRNRNILILLHDNTEIEVSAAFRWMTLGQIKELMKYPNLVNMDTRTVLSCIPFSLMEGHTDYAFTSPLLNSIRCKSSMDTIKQMYHYTNNIKMFSDTNTRYVKLDALQNWVMADDRIYCRHPAPFQIIFCDIEIEGREVTKWCQPLLEAIGISTFGLFVCEQQGVLKILVRCKPEIGCLDSVEFAPSVQREGVEIEEETSVDRIFFEKRQKKQGILFNNLLSEEGGRFYHEQNYNTIIKIEPEELNPLPAGYFWSDYSTLNHLVQVNNCLNIQLRNLLSTLNLTSI